MPRRSPRVTREHADRIVRKLNAAVDRGRGAHDLASVYYQDSLVVQFGIRRSSRKDTGHGHLPEDLHLSPHHTLRLANCPMSYEEWVERMRQKKVIS